MSTAESSSGENISSTSSSTTGPAPGSEQKGENIEKYNERQRAFDNIISSLQDEVESRSGSEGATAERDHLIENEITRAKIAVKNEEYPEALASFYRAERTWFERSKRTAPASAEEPTTSTMSSPEPTSGSPDDTPPKGGETLGRAKSIVELSKRFVPLPDRMSITLHLTDETGSVRENIEMSELIMAMEGSTTTP